MSRPNRLWPLLAFAACSFGPAAAQSRTDFLLVQELGRASPVRLSIPNVDHPTPWSQNGAVRQISVSPPGARPLRGFSLTLPVHNGKIDNVQQSIANGAYRSIGRRFGLPAYQFQDALIVYLIGWRGGTFVDIVCLDTDFSKLVYCNFQVIDRHGVSFGTELTPAQVAHWTEYVDEFNAVLEGYTNAGPPASGTPKPRRR